MKFFVGNKLGFIEKSTWTGRGVPKMSTFVHKGGGGIKKNPKKLSRRFVDDPLVIFLVDFLHEVAPGRQT